MSVTITDGNNSLSKQTDPIQEVEFQWSEYKEPVFDSLTKEIAIKGNLYYFDGHRFRFYGSAIMGKRKRSIVGRILNWLNRKID